VNEDKESDLCVSWSTRVERDVDAQRRQKQCIFYLLETQ